MPFAQHQPLGGNGDILRDLTRRVEILEARARAIQAGSQTFLDANGDVVLVVGQQADGTYGLRAFNPSSGAVEACVGQISASPALYGVAVLPYGGTYLQQVGGTLSTQPSSANNVTNTSPTAFGGLSSITCEIGPSGRADVSVQCQMSTGAANQLAQVVVQVDGGTWFGFLALSVAVAGGAAATVGATFPWGDLTPGTHTFTIGYVTSNNGSSTVTFNAPVLAVQPL